MSSDQFFGLYNYWIVVFLMMTGFYIVIARKNMIKTVIGLNIFQVSVVLLYITMGKVTGGTAPVIPPALAGQHDAHDQHDTHAAPSGHTPAANATAANETVDHGHADHVTELAHELAHELTHDATGDAIHGVTETAGVIYTNPLPSVLMLTAIVVGIATTAVALSLIVRISEDYGTIEEDEILQMDRRQ